LFDWAGFQAGGSTQRLLTAEVAKCPGLGLPARTGDDPNLGCPVEYISLKGTSYDKPAVCKYTGNKVWGVWGQERKLGGG
jgi:hypothetical protein